jgi:PmbA protein
VGYGCGGGVGRAGAGAAVAGAREPVVILGPWAVAEVLRALAPAFAGSAVDAGPLAGRLGTRVVAPSVNLSDSARYPATVPRSYDAEGVPRRPVPLIQDGVAHRVVHDSTSAAAAGTESTGHAVQPGGLAAPRPEHLVLVGGGASDLDTLVAGAADGLLIPALHAVEAVTGGPVDAMAQGVREIRDGRVGASLGTLRVRLDPLAVLARVEALTATQRTVPVPGAPAWAAGATVCPGLRAGGGLTRPAA